MARYITNAFSLNMLPDSSFMEVQIERISRQQANYYYVVWDAQSVVGHADTAAVFSSELGRDVPVNRATLKLQHGDLLLVGQYSGPRLPEGATKLPEGAKIEWMIVYFEVKQ